MKFDQMLMMFLRYIILNLVIAVIVTGCGNAPEPLYEGFTLREWVRSLESSEPGIRQDALEVIASAGPVAREWERSIRAVALNDEDNIVKMKAIETLAIIGAPVIEFQEFIDLYNAPLIPDGSEYFSESEEEEDPDILKNISGEDDLTFLKELESDNLLDAPVDTGMVPSDSVELALWVDERQSDAARDLLLSLENPLTLSKILLYGNRLQREYAARALIEMTGEDPVVITTLESIEDDDPDADIRKYASKALEKWKRP